jgi:ABC-type bacteriocin/lantibiotic exporter with double-glycine peptidase domain
MNEKPRVSFWQAAKQEVAGLSEMRMLQYPFQWMLEVSSLKMIIMVIALSSMQPLFDVLLPYFVKLTADVLSPQGSQAGIVNLIERFKPSWLATYYILIAFAGLSYFAGARLFDVATYFSRNITYAAERKMKDKLYFHIIFAPLKFHDSHKTGHLINTLNKVPSNMRQFLYTKGFTDGFPLIIRNIFICISIALIDWKLFAMMVPFMTLTLMVHAIGGRAVNKNEQRIWSSEKKLNEYLTQILMNMPIIKIFRREQRELDLVNKENSIQLTSNTTQSRNWRILSLTTGMMQLVLFITAMGYLSNQISRGTHTIGTLFQLSALIGMYAISFFKIAITYSDFRALAPKLKDALTIIHAEQERLEKPGQVSLPTIQHAIKLKNLSFTYEEKDISSAGKLALRNINCEIPAGKATLLAGENGSGKTTLLKILLGLYPFQVGSIEYDDHRFDEVTLRSIRSQFSMVDQGAWLMDGTIRDNIAYGSLKEVSEDEIMEAARVSGIHDYIMGLPLQYDTEVGEQGTKISGGERQRVAIARAIISKAPIIFFDEPLSSIDAPKRHQVWQDIRLRLKGKTIIVISHIPIESDNVIVIKQGQIVGVGTDQELRAAQLAEYCDLYPERLAA